MNPADWPVLFKAAVLGVVEGVTEFLPVSSTGHLILAGEWLDFNGGQAGTFEIFIQLGAILAITWIYRGTLAVVLRGLARDPVQQRFALNLIIAFLPAAVVGLLAHDLIKARLFSPLVVAVALVIGGVIILLIERRPPPTRVASVQAMGWRLALGVGLAQVLSLIPGTSRSGATIMGGYAMGMSRQAATEFSFFLAIPVMVAATLFDLLSSRDLLSRADVAPFAVGFVTAFVSALIVVKAFLGFVARHDFRGFAWYRIGFGVLLLVWYLRPGA
ncbi:MAG: undecaprenyl-diphosphate phosphatase [Gemmatimonadota bacterium]|nr:undecaprenyl-diphosphate phosphatase [Gemmatimonadota bacterium]